jgi:hypothetical protein
MTTLLFVLKRFVAQRLLGLAIVVTLAFTIGVLVAGPIYADAAREAILGSEVTTANVTVRNVRFTEYGDPGYPFADADASVDVAMRGVPLDSLVRQGRGTVRLATPEDADPLSMTVLFRSGAFDHVQLIGEQPTGPEDVALPTSVAKPRGIAVGDTITMLGPTGVSGDFQVTATYKRPDDAQSDYWYGTQTPFPSETRQPGQLGVAEQIPPALMTQDAYLASVPVLGVTTEFVWDAYVDYDGLRFERAEGLPGQVARADAQLQENENFTGLRTTTGVDTMIQLVRQRVEDLRVPILLVVFQIGAVTLAVLAGVGALVLSRQSFELAVLRSRGFSRGKLIAAQGFQGVLSALVAYPLGLLLGTALAILASNSNGPSLPGVLFPISISPTAQALGIVGAAIGAAALLLLSLPHVRRTILEERRLLSREERPLLARVPVELFVLPVAIFSFLQLRNTEVQSNVARANLDPLVLLTPTLLIFGLSFLSLRLLLFVLRRLDRRVGTTKRLGLYLAARRLGRSPGTSFATALLLVLSVGLLVVSTSYRAIVLGNHEDSAHQQVGSDWNIQVAVPDEPLAALRDAPPNTTGVIRSEPSFERTGNFSLTPSLLAIDPRTYGDAGWWRSDYSPVTEDEWLGELDAGDASVEVDGTSFTAQVTGDAAADGLRLLVTYVTPDGEVRHDRHRRRARRRRADDVARVPRARGRHRDGRGARRDLGRDGRHDAAAPRPVGGAHLARERWRRRADGERRRRHDRARSRQRRRRDRAADAGDPRVGLARGRAVTGSGLRRDGRRPAARVPRRRDRRALPERRRRLRRRLDADLAPSIGEDPRTGPRAERGVGERFDRPAARPRAGGVHPGQRARRWPDRRGARAAAAVARRRDELRGGGRRARARRPRRRRRPLLRAEAPRVRVRVAPSDGRRAVADLSDPAARAGGDDRVRDRGRARHRLWRAAARDAVRRPQHRFRVPRAGPRPRLGVARHRARGDRRGDGDRAARGDALARALVGDVRPAR